MSEPQSQRQVEQKNLHDMLRDLQDALELFSLRSRRVLHRLDMKAARAAEGISAQIEAHGSTMKPEHVGQRQDDAHDLIQEGITLLVTCNALDCVPDSAGWMLVWASRPRPTVPIPATAESSIAKQLRAESHRFDDPDEVTPCGIPSAVFSEYLKGDGPDSSP